ncbi:MAG TPA: nicotinate-nucleotide adenylyltransferase [Pyrinomonadaceae bacterium]|nr:nicotinate-nucleotide adenylyltransferase [Pyrinomonadaceae bacterium]
MPKGQERIAIYGGTFDPVHYGHLAVAQSIIELFEISELLFVPARHAPHKIEREVSAALHRYAMLVLATRTDARLLISTFELEAPHRGYTVDTLQYFRRRFGDRTELFFVMGADSWLELTTWREWQRLVQLAHQVVVTRPGYELKLDHEAGSGATVLDVRGWDNKQVARAMERTAGPKVFVSDAAMVDIAATAVRDTARSGPRSVLETLVPPEVADYIAKYELYKNGNET